MIDIHVHILAGFDDGPETIDQSLRTAKAFVKAGYTKVVATPHIIEGVYANTKDLILDGVRLLNERLVNAGIALTVLPGAEYHISNRLLSLLKAGGLVTINETGKFILIELPVHDVPPFTDRVLFDLMLAGITPILAHPERNEYLSRRPEVLAEMVRKGILMQITAGSIVGLFGAGSKRAGNYLLKKGLAHFVATDAHGPGRRLEAGLNAAELLGNACEQILVDNPENVVSGNPVTSFKTVSVDIEQKAGWLKRVFNVKK